MTQKITATDGVGRNKRCVCTVRPWSVEIVTVSSAFILGRNCFADRHFQVGRHVEYIQRHTDVAERY